MRFLRPKALQDIQRAPGRVFQHRTSRVNLGYHYQIRIPVTYFLKISLSFVAAWILILGSVTAPTITPTLAANPVLPPPTTQEEREELEAQLKNLEGQIDEYENQISGYRKQGSTLNGEIGKLNTNISKLNLQIQAITLTLTQLDQKIGDTESRISITENTITGNKKALANLLKEMYMADRATLMEIFLKNPKLSDFFGDINNISVLQNNLRITIEQISDLKDDLEDQRDQYELARADAATIKQYRATQIAETDKIKKEKNSLLQITKGQETKYQALLKQTQATAAQIRSRIFQLLGGGQLTFEQAYDYAKVASGATGVRPALILAVLDRESAFGQNVGKCKYNEVNSKTGKATMHPTRDVAAFLEITSALGINPESVAVSCAIPRDGAYGGAMGPAQFIPSTWKMYVKSIANITGNNPPSPWNNADAFAATALYLKESGAANATTLAVERKAAARYYAGGNWQRYLWTYGQAVINKAEQFEDDIKEINR